MATYPLLHHGMLVCGLPYTEHALSKTTTGGTPYGASHVAGPANSNPISDDEKTMYCTRKASFKNWLGLEKRLALR